MARLDLPKCDANYGPLSPLSFIERTASVYPEKNSVIYGHRSFTWGQTLDRCRRLASFLCSPSAGLSSGDTVSVLAPNVPAMYELHFAVPMAGVVLNTINIRLDARTIGVILAHAEAKVVFVDIEFLPTLSQALRVHFPSTSFSPLIILINDENYENSDNARAAAFGSYVDYEELIARGDPEFSIRWPKDEWDTISLNYTSGTTSAPKGVLYHHRGAYMNSLMTILAWEMKSGPVFLWIVPMFHCNGWSLTWAVAAQAGTNICLRNVTPKAIFDAIAKFSVTHFSAVPTVLTMIADSQEHDRKPLLHRVEVLTGGAPPSATTVSSMEALGFGVSHAYGLTETYGSSTICAWKDEWNSLNALEQAKLRARQGVGHLATSGLQVVNAETMTPVPRDGRTMGEVILRGNTVMKGYFKDQRMTEEAFKGGWFHTGDLGVMHPDGYLQLTDRAKDIIISGGENISSIEVESILQSHPQILEAAVVSCHDEFWGEVPCAFITLKIDSSEPVSEKSIIEWSRENMPRFMIPRRIVFGVLPKTATGKIQKNVLRDEARKLFSTKSSLSRSKL